VKRFIKINTLLLLMIIITALCSCENHYDDIKKRFEPYLSDDNVVAVLDDCVFYFTDHTLDLRDIVSDDERPNQGYLFLDKTLYFSTTKQTGFFEHSVCVYTCDLYGNEKSLIFEKHGYKTHPWAVGKNSVLYFEYYNTHSFDETERVIDSFDVLSGAYELEETGKNADLSNYRNQSKGKAEYSNNAITWVDPEDCKTHFIDLSKLDSLDEALNGLDYSYSGGTVFSERLFLIYRIEESAGGLYPHLICEYVPETSEIRFKSLVFTYDIAPIKVRCF